MKKTVFILCIISSHCFGFSEADCASLYTGISGYGIDQAEATSLTEKGAAPTYGEATYEAFERMAQIVKPELKNGIFYDLGCGVGKGGCSSL